MKVHAAEMLEKEKNGCEPVLNSKAIIRGVVRIRVRILDKMLELAERAEIGLVIIGKVDLVAYRS